MTIPHRNDPSPADWLAEGWPHVWLPYTQMATAPLPPPAARTRGTTIILEDGRELLDGVASWWTACHGYNHPHLISALKRQAEVMPHVMFGGLANEPAFRLATRLAALLPGDLNRVFFVDGGSVAVEVAMKMAIQFNLNRGRTGRTKFVSFRHGYHGDTLAAMSVCDPEEGMHALFAGVLAEQHVVPLPRLKAERDEFAAFLRRVRHEVAAVMIEPLLQGAGGMKTHDPETLRFVAETAAANDVLLIADEIFTGFGRTGTMFACEAAGVVPDVMCLSKALTGGVMGLAAAVATDRVFEAFLSDDPNKALMHGPTYMANPLACAVANASLDLFAHKPRLRQVADIEAGLRDGLEPCRDLPGVVDVRVLGAVGAVQVEKLHDVAWLRAQFLDRGVWLRPFGDILYTTPAFVMTADDVARLTGVMVEVATAWSDRFGRR